MKWKLTRYEWGVCAILFIAIATVIFLMRGQYNSPDERANDFFARQFARVGVLSAPASTENAQLSYPLFPRSTQPVANMIRPVGFIGLSLVYGIVAMIVGEWIIPFLTLLAFFAGAWAWWCITRRVFGEWVARVSVWLYLFHPALLYYTVRGLYPNMLLLTMMLCAVAAGLHAYERTRMNVRIAWGIATLMFMLIALLVRPPEAFMLCALVISAAAVFGEKQIRRHAIIAFTVLAVVALLALFLRRVGALSGAYPFLRDSSPFAILFPFGVHLKFVWHNAIHFIVRLFWPWVLVSTVGLLWWLYESYRTRTWPRMILAYLWVVVPASVWLFLAYGSWQVFDNPADPQAVTIGISYVRYWLPHLLFRMPFAVVFLFALRKKYFPQWQEWVVGLTLVLSLGLFGIWRLWSGVDGLGAVLQENRTAAVEVSDVMHSIPQNAVLAVRAWDKHFFPTARVLQPFPQDVRAVRAVHELRALHIPVYAFIETLKEVDVRWLTINNLRAREIQHFGVHTLYEITE